MGQIDIAKAAGSLDDAIEVDALPIPRPGRVRVHAVLGISWLAFRADEDAVVVALDFVEQNGVRVGLGPVKYIGGEILAVWADGTMDADGIFNEGISGAPVSWMDHYVLS